MQFQLSYTHRLVSLVEQTAMLAGRLADLSPEQLAPLQAAARRDTARCSARLDGSPLEPETMAAVDGGGWRRAVMPVEADQTGGWVSALRLDVMETQEVAAIEYHNLRGVYDAEPELAGQLFDAPLETLARLHGLICHGLVEPDVIGRSRRTEQAVHDGAQGMVIFNAPDHEALPGLLEGLARWLRGEGTEGSAAFPAPVVAAIVHERLLQWQPYEAANGRLARAVSRLVLRARDMDRHGLVVPERQWVRDPAGYYGEVAATMRRRDDVGPWVERQLETLSGALSESVSAARLPVAPPAPRALRLLAELYPGEVITVAEYAERVGCSRETAWQDLRDLMVAGHVMGEPRSLGRRFRRL